MVKYRGLPLAPPIAESPLNHLRDGCRNGEYHTARQRKDRFGKSVLKDQPAFHHEAAAYYSHTPRLLPGANSAVGAIGTPHDVRGIDCRNLCAIRPGKYAPTVLRERLGAHRDRVRGLLALPLLLRALRFRRSRQRAGSVHTAGSSRRDSVHHSGRTLLSSPLDSDPKQPFCACGSIHGRVPSRLAATLLLGQLLPVTGSEDGTVRCRTARLVLSEGTQRSP
jgi:hypothetical protein